MPEHQVAAYQRAFREFKEAEARLEAVVARVRACADQAKSWKDSLGGEGEPKIDWPPEADITAIIQAFTGARRGIQATWKALDEPERIGFLPPPG